MATRIPYTYTEFQNCPQATEISRTREESKVRKSLLCGVLFALSLLFCFVDSADRWIAICGVILCPIWFLYLMVFYDRATNKMIAEAIQNANENNEQ